MRPLAGRNLGGALAEHSLSRRIKDDEFAVLVGDDDAVPDAGQDGFLNLIGTGELGGPPRYFFFQLLTALAQRLLQFPLLRNVGVSPKPARDFAVGVKNGKGARKKPSVFTGST